MDTVAEIKRIFREYGLAPKKWMGQNLLVDPRHLKRIGESAGIVPGEPIVEVGAGLGVLTRELADRGATVHALEVDSGFFRVLQEKFGSSAQVKLIHADALKYDFGSLAEEIGTLRVVANLPYNVSSRLLFMFCRNREIFRSLHILLQEEVADRLTAEPGTKAYGVLTVLLGATGVVEILFAIPPKAFFPVPEVTSAFVRVDFPRRPPISVADSGLFVRLVKASFAGRRKTLRNTLKNAGIPGVPMSMLAEAADATGIDLGRRGETLSPHEFAQLANAVHSRAVNHLGSTGCQG